MRVNGVEFNCELEDILNELKTQLQMNGIYLLDKIKQSGNNIMVSCPYHNNGKERRPSAGIKKDDGTFHCFACGETHSLPEMISHCFGKDSTGLFGWTWLLKNFISIEREERHDVRLDLERNKNSLGDDRSLNVNNSIGKSNSEFISKQELDSYRYIHPYMYKRKLNDSIIEMFDIGYDKETDCITFPIRDVSGNTLAIARRSTKGKYFNYPSGFEKPLYGVYEILQRWNSGFVGGAVYPDEIIVCESMLDALTCWVYGKYAVALNGLGTQLQFKQLRELPCRKLILATDNDEAGMKARKRIRQNITNKLITEYILPSDKKDINELSKEEFDNLQEVF